MSVSIIPLVSVNAVTIRCNMSIHQHATTYKTFFAQRDIWLRHYRRIHRGICKDEFECVCVCVGGGGGISCPRNWVFCDCGHWKHSRKTVRFFFCTRSLRLVGLLVTKTNGIWFCTMMTCLSLCDNVILLFDKKTRNSPIATALNLPKLYECKLIMTVH